MPPIARVTALRPKQANFSESSALVNSISWRKNVLVSTVSVRTRPTKEDLDGIEVLEGMEVLAGTGVSEGIELREGVEASQGVEVVDGANVSINFLIDF
jgi:hypothetical protein